jgi:uncharacterized protein YjbJ (UPF0337 family)
MARRRIRSMKSSTKDTGKPDLEDRGTAEKIKGTVRNKLGDVKKVFGS